jgi:cell division cycle 20-like protein 1, cofactor of APC complex
MNPDRFIPNRTSTITDYTSYRMLYEKDSSEDNCGSTLHLPCDYNRAIGAVFFGVDIRIKSPILKFRPPSPPVSLTDVVPAEKKRTIVLLSPISTYDVPNLVNNAYNHALALSSRIAAIAAGDELYVYDTGKNQFVGSYHNTPYHDISSVAWHSSNKATLGTEDSTIKLLDLNRKTCTTLFQLKAGAVHVLAKAGRKTIIAGCNDGSLCTIDFRMKRIIKLQAHRSLVCSLSVSPDQMRIASGGNDNTIHIYDVRQMNKPLTTFLGHEAAVTCSVWYDNHHLISGSGTADQTLRIWCLNSNKEFTQIHTGSQVCTMHLLSKNEIVTTHGFSQPEVNTWDITGGSFRKTSSVSLPHKDRILYSDWDGSSLITGSSPDGVVAVWDLESSKDDRKKKFSKKETAFSMPILR